MKHSCSNLIIFSTLFILSRYTNDKKCVSYTMMNLSIVTRDLHHKCVFGVIRLVNLKQSKQLNAMTKIVTSNIRINDCTNSRVIII